MNRPIVKRCAWCTPAHLMDSENQTIPGPVDDYAHYQYSDGICLEAEKIENAALDKLIAKRQGEHNARTKRN